MIKLPKLICGFLATAMVSTASAVVLIDISLDDNNTTASQAVINFNLSGNIDSGTAPAGTALNLLFLDLNGSPLTGQLVDSQTFAPSGDGLAITNSGLAPNNAFETRLNNGVPRLGIAFSGNLNAGASFSGTATGTFATTSLIDVDDLDGLTVFWGGNGDGLGGITAGPNVGLTTVTPVPEASSFAAIAGLGVLGFIATRRRFS